MATCSHEWVDVTPLGSLTQRSLCGRCGELRESLLPPPSQIPLGYRTSSGILMRRAREGSGNGDPYNVSVIRDMNGHRAEYGCGCVWSIDEGSLLRAFPAPRGPREMCEAFCPSHASMTYPPSYPGTVYVGGSVYSGSLSLSVSNPSYTPPTPAPRPDLELTFETEPVVGFRMWRVVTHHLHGGITEPRLQPLTGRSLWEPRERYVAQCLPTSSRYVYGVHAGETHEAPHRDCDCGTWAVKDKADLPNSRGNNHGLVAIGEVYMWGRVLEFKKGYRAKYAYPKALTLMSGDGEMADELARVYGVPVECDDPGPRYSMLVDEAAGLGADPLAWLNQYMGTFRAPTNPVPIMLSTDPIDPPTTTGGFLKKALDEAAAKLAENEAKIKALERAKKPTPPRQKPTLRDAFKRR